MAQGTKTLRILSGRAPVATQGQEAVVLVDEAGSPVDVGGGSDGPTQAEHDALAARVEALESGE